MSRFAGAALALALLALPAVAAPPLAVRGGVVHTLAGEAISDGVVVVGQDGKIVAVGPAAEVLVPEGARILEAAVVVPGLVDAHSVVGLSGYLNTRFDQDQLERSAAIQPELRALDAYDAREKLVGWLRGLGVTTLHTGHAPGALVPGQTMVVKTRGDTVEEAVVVETAMVAVTLGSAAAGRDGKPPGTRAKQAAMLRAELVKAAEYRAKRDKAAKPPATKPAQGKDKGEGKPPEPPPRNLHLEVLAQVLDGTLPLLVSAERHQDIATALRLKREFGFRLVLDGGAEAYLLTAELRDAGVPVIVHPTMARPRGDRENLTLENAARLADAGLTIALQSGYESYVPKTRVVLFEAAVAAAHGLGFERALRAVTLDAARILGLDERLGSLEPGKDGDLALYDGDPFEPTTHCLATVIEGELVSEGPR